jgi:hypothetical protein
MKGQWIGRTTGSQIGQIILHVDDMGSHFSGVAFTLPDDVKFPLSASFFDTKKVQVNTSQSSQSR